MRCKEQSYPANVRAGQCQGHHSPWGSGCMLLAPTSPQYTSPAVQCHPVHQLSHLHTSIISSQETCMLMNFIHRRPPKRPSLLDLEVLSTLGQRCSNWGCAVQDLHSAFVECNFRTILKRWLTAVEVFDSLLSFFLEPLDFMVLMEQGTHVALMIEALQPACSQSRELQEPNAFK